jgi:CspA family cold shock protein
MRNSEAHLQISPFSCIAELLPSSATEFKAIWPFSLLTHLAQQACCLKKLCFRERKHIMPTGTVKFFNIDKGYGFISNEDGSGDAFVHITAVERAGMATLNKDQRITYELELDKRGKTSAINLVSA